MIPLIVTGIGIVYLFSDKQKEKKQGLNGVKISSDINHENFHINTFGKFKKISEGLTRFLLNNIKQLEIGEYVFYHNNKYILKYKSFSSFYFINENKTILYRVSDHWSNNIGFIASCYWTINKLSSKRFTAGKIYFKNLKSRNIIVKSVSKLPKKTFFNGYITTKQGYFVFIEHKNKFEHYYKYLILKKTYIDFILSFLKNIKNLYISPTSIYINKNTIKYFDFKTNTHKTKKIKQTHIYYDLSLFEIGVSKEDIIKVLNKK